ncbi:hypothetical protein AB670_01621 [Chryseobacterium sp. MOF25P]|nr:hypothetical protein AB670_01621 [Chryseobacterium sp. MOF25P]OBW44145.1 hypothetical protein AB671_03792 [Chryseobacterium sp. BGARF1]
MISPNFKGLIIDSSLKLQSLIDNEKLIFKISSFSYINDKIEKKKKKNTSCNFN